MFIKKDFSVFESFFVCLASKFEKGTNMTKKIFYQKRYKKRRISNPLKKFLKICTNKKLLAKT
jgi:hypothetical protein